jgi:hypothetical protein
MEDLFKVMGDALYPNCQVKADTETLKDESFEDFMAKFNKRQDAFDKLFKAIGELKESEDRVKIYQALKFYLLCV